MATQTIPNAAAKTKRYLVDGPGGKWSIWDHGDEMAVCDGPDLTSRVVATVPVALASRLDAGGRWEHVVDAANAIHVAKLLNSDSPNFRKLWRAR